jgi:moderate conductance mechanosensitive channel
MSFEPLFLIPSSGDEWREWFGDNGINVIGILIGLILVRLLVTRVIGRVIRSASLRAAKARAEDPALVERRVDTLLATIGWMFTIFLALIGLALVLDQFEVQVSALIAGVGVAGIAIGLGAQTLIKDVINGMFILIEGQYAVGDVVNVAGVGGLVIEITPRRTVLRDQNGHVHIIPNSAITVATNMTQGFSRINLNVSVAYEEDIAHVTQVINDECEKLAADFPMDIIVTPKVLRVDSLGADGIDIKILGDVKVFRQWDLMGELRRRLKARFDVEGIEIPYHREVQVPFAGPMDERIARRTAPAAEQANSQDAE